MDELIYYDPTGKYFLLDYAVSHSEIVFRRIEKTDPNNIFNIDLFFKAVYHIQIMTRLEGVKVSRVTRKDILDVIPNQGKREEIYRIEDSEGNIGYIDASVFVVFHNKLSMLETSLGDFTWSSENKEIISSVIN